MLTLQNTKTKLQSAYRRVVLQNKRLWVTISGPLMAVLLFLTFNTRGPAEVSPALLIPLYILVVAYSGFSGRKTPAFIAAFLAMIHIDDMLFGATGARLREPYRLSQALISGTAFFVIAYISSRIRIKYYFFDFPGTEASVDEDKPHGTVEKFSLYEKLPHMVWIASAEGEDVYHNTSWHTYTGLPLKDLTFAQIEGVVHPDDAVGMRREWKKALLAGTPFEYEYRIKRHDGVFRWHLARCVPSRDGNGAVAHWIGTCTDIEEKKEVEEQLRKSEMRYKSFVANGSEALWRFELRQPIAPSLTADEQIDLCYRYGYLAECNDAMAKMYGYDSAEQIVGAQLGDLMPREDEKNTAMLRAFIDSGYRLSEAESHEVDRFGNKKFFLNSLVGIMENGLLVRTWGMQRDITEYKKIQEQLRSSSELQDMILNSINDAVLVLGPGEKVLYANEAAAKGLGMESGPNTRSLTSEEFQATIEMYDEFSNRVPHTDLPAMQAFRGVATSNGLFRFRNTKTGDETWQIISAVPLFEDDQTLKMVIVTSRDMTSFRKAQDTIQHQAFHDMLTGLPNRKAFETRLERELERAAAKGTVLAVMFMDLDRFKDINDTFGHEVGDEIFREVASRLKSCIKETDLVARWGGDEFIMAMPNVMSSFDAGRIATRILKALEPEVRIGDRVIHIRGSIGIALYPQDGTDVLSLQKNADIALYKAKEMGKNRFQHYNQKMNANAAHRMALEHELRLAVMKKEFRLLYQPVVDIKTGAVHSAEALLRWNHPSRGFLKPSEFLDIAEESGLIVELGHWAIQAAGMARQEWSRRGHDLNVVVNISGRQFSEPEMVEKIMLLLERAGIDPRHFEVEVTESVAMENVDRTRHKLEALKERGISLTIDDFGTGYSSLNYLKSFAIDKLKIDKSFVNHCITSPKDLSIIKAIISMAHGLGLKVVAEGVNSETQMSLLHSLGCDKVQGYYVSKPLTSTQLMEWLASRTVQSPAPPLLPGPAEAQRMVEDMFKN